MAATGVAGFGLPRDYGGLERASSPTRARSAKRTCFSARTSTMLTVSWRRVPIGSARMIWLPQFMAAVK